jgi:CBS domain-containing protein
MSKAYDVMTKSLATCRPDDNAMTVAKIMKDRDIGDVLVVDDGKLLGIVTDRDLAVNALSEGEDAGSSPISRYMTRSLITGAATWGLNKIAKTMAKNQIRRLPIVENGEIVGIISLGDIARHYGRKDIITDSLKNISRPNNTSSLLHDGSLGKWLGIGLLGLTAGAAYWLTMSHTGQQFRKQVIHSKTYNTARQAINDAGVMMLDKVNEAATSKSAQNLRKQVKANIKDISSQIPTSQYKSIKNKAIKTKKIWFQ